MASGVTDVRKRGGHAAGREKVEGGAWQINCSRMLLQRTLGGAELLGYKGLDLGHGHELMCIVPA